MKDVLVCYFSASGVTKKVGEKIASYLNCQTFEIKPLVLYTPADLDWTNKESRSSIEMANRSSRPDLASKLDNLDDYNTILIGFPIWWDLAPTIINTFIESTDLTNKKIYIFVTSGGSSVTNSLEDLRKTYQDLNIVDGIKLNNNFTIDDIKSFIV